MVPECPGVRGFWGHRAFSAKTRRVPSKLGWSVAPAGGEPYLWGSGTRVLPHGVTSAEPRALVPAGWGPCTQVMRQTAFGPTQDRHCPQRSHAPPPTRGPSVVPGNPAPTLTLWAPTDPPSPGTPPCVSSCFKAWLQSPLHPCSLLHLSLWRVPSGPHAAPRPQRVLSAPACELPSPQEIAGKLTLSLARSSWEKYSSGVDSENTSRGPLPSRILAPPPVSRCVTPNKSHNLSGPQFLNVKLIHNLSGWTFHDPLC